MKKVYETKKGLLEGRWIVQNKESISQPSFISTNVIDGDRYGKGYNPDIIYNKCVKKILYQTSSNRPVDFLQLQVNWEGIIEWKNSTSPHPIDGLYESSDLNTDKLRRSLYSEPLKVESTVKENLRVLQIILNINM